MKKTFKFAAAAGLLLSAFSAFADTFVFTAIPDEDESRLQQRFNKVADYLSAQTGAEVKYIPVKSYAAAITAFRNNQVQLAWFGGLSGVQARAPCIRRARRARGGPLEGDGCDRHRTRVRRGLGASAA